MKYVNIREEELKNKIANDYFNAFDCTKIIGNIDFCVGVSEESLFWAEAKKGISDIHHALVQLILTIGKARTFDKFLPPPMLGAFDAEKIAFIPYNKIHDIFYQNDFNWNVAPSNHETKEFKQIHEKVQSILHQETLVFTYDKDDDELKDFIELNFINNGSLIKSKIDKNNFIVIYNKWLQAVKPTIAVSWDIAKKNGIIDGDFYLADLLSYENNTLKEKLFVLLKHDHYELNRKVDASGLFSHSTATFNDKQIAHTQFWNRYERPPQSEYWDYIVERRDLLVPQDVRERKGSFFTPQMWVELSQKYLTDTLGDNWQDEYTVWDCAAGTGNLLNGLTNKYNIWASTLDMQDVEVMKDRIKNGANLLESHVFPFDFLNDDFSQLPKGLQDIINHPEKCKKLVIYINPPYAEATSARTVAGTGENKAGVATNSRASERYKPLIGSASNEMFALFMARIYEKMPYAILGQFSKMKFIQGSNFRQFKTYFLAKYLGGFIVPASTFDNVKGKFPIGFTLWDLSEKEKIKRIKTTVFESNGKLSGKKYFYGNLKKSINKWLVDYYGRENAYKTIGTLSTRGNDFQNQKYIYIATAIYNETHDTKVQLSQFNIIPISVYFSVRHCMEASWLNDRDQFLYPNGGWKNDTQFQNDCLTFSLFHSQNRVSSVDGINHWIPFTEQEVNAKDTFESHFMTQFIKGKLKPECNGSLINDSIHRTTPLIFSKEAQAVFEAGKALWRYYHQQENDHVNASFYDIRAYFQGRNHQGKMNHKSNDGTYMALIESLREAQKNLQKVIVPKVYDYEFLK